MRTTFILLCIFSILGAFAQTVTIDPVFNQYDNGHYLGDGPVGGVDDVVMQPDGKLIICGGITSYNGTQLNNAIARINVDGTLDTTFQTPLSPSSYYAYGSTLCLQPDGKILFGGIFNQFGGMSLNHLVRLNSDGSIDTAFCENLAINGGIVQDIGLLSDGRIAICGYFTSVGGLSSSRIAQLMPDGTVDSSFVGFSDAPLEALAIQSDDKIVAVGSVFSQTDNGIVRFNHDGSRDTLFENGTGFNNPPRCISIRPDGKMVIGGSFVSYDGVPVSKLVLLDSNGAYNPAFQPNVSYFSNSITEVTALADGRVFASSNQLVRFLPNGETDESFAEYGVLSTGNATTAFPDNNGKYIVFGNFSWPQRRGLLRIYEDGGLDIHFNEGNGAASQLSSMEVDGAGRILIAGSAGLTQFNNTCVRNITRLLPNGMPDTTFLSVNGPDNAIRTIAIRPDNKLFVGGHFQNYFGQSLKRLALLDANGMPDPSFNPGNGANDVVTVSALQPDGKLLIAGLFTNYNAATRIRIARVNPDGSNDATFNPGTGVDGNVQGIALQPDGKIILTGSFSSYNGTGVNNIVRLLPNGSVDASFVTGAGFNYETVKSVLQPDGKVLVAGSFTQYNGASCNGIIRLNTDGSPDNSFNSGSGFPLSVFIGDLDLLADGRILVSGSFTSFNGSPCNNIVLLNANGSEDTLLDFGSGFDNVVANSHVLPNGKLLVSGNFSTFNGEGRNRIARLLDCTPSYGSDTVVHCGPYTWIDGQTYTSDNNTALFALPASGGCDSIITLHLTVLSPSYATQTANECGSSYTWPQNGFTYTVSGSYTDTIPNAAGCDSIVTLDLTFLAPTDAFITESACETYTWAQTGLTYTVSGIYIDTIPNAVGCDSIIVLYLTVLEPTSALSSETACGSYLWPPNGQIYTISGQYTDTIPNAVGCDSVITLDLTILEPTTDTQTVASAGDYTWPQNGLTYTTSGTYADTIPNAAGCDSVIVLELTVYPSSSVNTFSMPSDTSDCNGGVAITIAGVPDFTIDIGNGSPVTTSGYAFIDNLCPGIYGGTALDGNGDTLGLNFIVPVDSNYIFNNPFIDSLALDSLGSTVAECDIYYNSIDSAYIADLFANADTVTVTWAIIDSSGLSTIETTYILGNGAGVYDLQLSIFCPQKSTEEYFVVTQAIYFDGNDAHVAGLSDNLLPDVSIYPNPTNDLVTLSFAGPDIDLVVYDAQGKLVLAKQRIQSGAAVSLQYAESGVYFFELNTGNGKAVKRIVKH